MWLSCWEREAFCNLVTESQLFSELESLGCDLQKNSLAFSCLSLSETGRLEKAVVV